MHTHFASARRTDPVVLTRKIEIVQQHPVMDGLLRSLGGLLAVLDANRQIVALNDALLAYLGIDDPERALGMRPGEALSCVHADAAPAGCGTSRACASCGAVIAIVSSLDADAPVERLCALKASKDGLAVELVLKVRSQPMRIEGQRFLLLFIQDVTDDQRRAALERTFFHDINNLLAILLGASEILQEEQPGEISRTVYQVAQCLKSEVHLQACLLAGDSGDYQPAWERLTVDQVLADLQRFFAAHTAARERELRVLALDPPPFFLSDRAALLRVLNNMVLNALEATDAGGLVKVWATATETAICFSVWNHQAIPEAVQTRIFQRSFSTKAESGRGLGTYSIKLFGEKLLGGAVDFSSSAEKGTTFRLTLPLSPGLESEG